MKNIKPLVLLFLMILCVNLVHAQPKSGVDGLLRSNGRIYVVVAVMLTILIGLFIYLIRLDRKISRLEKE
jgi:hypothetical protein